MGNEKKESSNNIYDFHSNTPIGAVNERLTPTRGYREGVKEEEMDGVSHHLIPCFVIMGQNGFLLSYVPYSSAFG